MGLSVRERADVVATFRFISVYLMETLARWVPTTPELEVKVLFGRHLWDLAQHADAFGKRTAELRLAVQASREPTTQFMKVLKEFAQVGDTAERVDGFYAGVMPGLEVVYRNFLDTTDPIMDEPTVRIVERVLIDFTRMRDDREKLRTEQPEIALTENQWVSKLSEAGGSFRDIVDFRPAPQTPATVS